jgi:hypothetical protein
MSQPSLVTRPVAARVPNQVAEELEAEAQLRGITVSAVAREAIIEGMPRCRRAMAVAASA